MAYEPVWAIGTGKTATAAQAQEMHAFIRQTLADKYGKEVSENCSILYGGSCKPSNAKELFANPDVDGGLIGGAALEVESFMGIIEAFYKTANLQGEQNDKSSCSLAYSIRYDTKNIPPSHTPCRLWYFYGASTGIQYRHDDCAIVGPFVKRRPCCVASRLCSRYATLP